MPKILEGQLNAAPYKFAIAVSRFNEFITRRLVDSAVDCLRRHGADDNAIQIVYCPGAFELPQIARRLAQNGSFDAIICLGCVIKGSTPHFEYVCNAATSGINKVALETGAPIVFGLLTTDSLEQAIERAGTKGGNKGWDAALGAIELADVARQLTPKRSK
jgi:6,7-dimethyl-8-ribityllumazine synthase